MDIYQKRREPDTWDWQVHKSETNFNLIAPTTNCGNVALVISLSGDILDDDIYKAIGTDVSIWHIKAENPSYDCLSTQQDLSKFRQTMRLTLNQIKKRHGTNHVIHIRVIGEPQNVVIGGTGFLLRGHILRKIGSCHEIPQF